MTPVELKSSFPVIVTSQLAQARDFYTNHFGFRVVFQADWYVQLHADRQYGGPPVELAFMLPDLPDLPPALRAASNGAGVILTLELQEVDGCYEKLRQAGCEMVVELCDEPGGQRHFLLRDPAGTLLDVVKIIPASAEYAAAYAEPRE